jgi:murein DD-endopeptidase MepM/ murein hydrolase activator NlpD
MRWVPWIVGGGALAYVWKRGKRSGVRAPSAPLPTALDGRWVWPVPTYQGRRPVISDGFDSPRPNLPRHGGVDLMFARVASDTFASGTPNGTRLFVMPDGVPALAASDGAVWSATHTPQGFAVVIDHGPRKMATFYAHLEKLLVAPKSPGKSGERVRAGQPIGIIGASPRDSEHLKHLHFEIWLGGPSDRIDPAPVMRSWEVFAEPSTLVARNGSLIYRPI